MININGINEKYISKDYTCKDIDKSAKPVKYY
jgi:hypothetical protein